MRYCARFRLLGLILACLGSFLLAAQNVKMPENPYRIAKRQLEVIPLHLSYVYQNTQHLGIKMGIDFPFRFVESRFISENGAQRRLTEHYLTTDLGFSYDKTHQNMASFQIEWLIRRLRSTGFFWQVSPLGLGVVYPFMWTPAPMGQDLSNNSIYWGPSASVGVGKDFGYLWRGTGLPMAFSLKATVLNVYPANNWKGHLRPMAEATLAYRFRRINTFVRKIRKN